QNILDAAGAVVANNPERLGKSLNAEKGAGANLRYFEGRDAQAEAEFVAGELERILNDDSDQTCAVEYRTNFQSRAFEEVFRRRALPLRNHQAFCAPCLRNLATWPCSRTATLPKMSRAWKISKNSHAPLQKAWKRAKRSPTSSMLPHWSATQISLRASPALL